MGLGQERVKFKIKSQITLKRVQLPSQAVSSTLYLTESFSSSDFLKGLLLSSLQNRRISRVSATQSSACAKRENEREASSQNNLPVVTPLFMLFQPFTWRTVCADWLLYIT